MGSLCSKETDEKERHQLPPPVPRRVSGASSKASRQLVVTSQKPDVVVLDEKARKIQKNGDSLENAVVKIQSLEKEKSLEADDQDNEDESGFLDGGERNGFTLVPNGFAGEHVAAGWPPWLATAAAEAIKGWLPRKSESFERLDKIGQGTYSNVFKARDLETGKLVALKKIRFANLDPQSVRFMAREIQILRQLDHPNVVKLECLVTSPTSSNLYLVFEYMDHDLAGLLANSSIKFTEPQIKCYMKQLLLGLLHCHSHGVLHRDIKGANLLINNDGILKLADFGLATFFSNPQKQPMTSRVITLWYRPPELLLGATEYDGSVDLWSAGCILAEMFSGRPILPGRTEVEQLHKIFKLCGSPSEEYWKTYKLAHATAFKPQHPYPRCLAETFGSFPPTAVGLLESLLAIEPDQRGTASDALESEFFNTTPVACDPASLPKYQPSKEYDIKLQNEAVKRKKAIAATENGSDSATKSANARKAKEIPNVNAEKAFIQKMQLPADSTPVERAGKSMAYSGPVIYQGASRPSSNRRDGDMRKTGHLTATPGAFKSSQVKIQMLHSPQGGEADLPYLSGPLASGSGLSSRCNQLNETSPSDIKYEIVDGQESTREYGSREKKFLFSGPLMRPGGNMEEMLKVHERQVQQAIHQAKHGKARSKNQGGREKTMAVHYPARTGSSSNDQKTGFGFKVQVKAGTPTKSNSPNIQEIKRLHPTQNYAR